MNWIRSAADDQLEMGIKVEMEHVDTIKWLIGQVNKGTSIAEDLIKETAKRIASDHLKENSKYYSLLAEMEKGFK